VSQSGEMTVSGLPAPLSVLSVGADREIGPVSSMHESDPVTGRTIARYRVLGKTSLLCQPVTDANYAED
jgi:hypothetical protein